MEQGSLQGKRILVTQADAFMGPMICDVLAEHGASVAASTESLIEPEAPGAVVAAAGPIDILIANLSINAPTTPVTEVSEEELSYRT